MAETMERLGLTPYTLRTSFNNASTHAIEWSDIYAGKKRVNVNFLSKYDCLVGPPSSIVFDKVFEACPPYTKVILVEEPNKEQWAAELESHLPKVIAASEHLKGHSRVADQVTAMLKGMFIEPLSPQAGGYAAALDEFEHKVKTTIPSNRLLLWRYGEGYEPICEFLGIESVPTEPFPSYHSGFDIIDKLANRLAKARTISRSLIIVVLFISCIMLWPLFKKGGAVMDDLHRDYQIAFSKAEESGKDINTARNAMILAKDVTVSFEEKWRNKGALGVVTTNMDNNESRK